ncbi:MAG: T9SS type A sorting domain-containing protein [Bacteroidetes bacterium]|nr:T9SS type A sorting domain-containing protein [Bacteroidota bacterium]
MKKVPAITLLAFVSIIFSFNELFSQVPTLVEDLFQGGQSSYPKNITAVGNKVYFAATSNFASGEELWVSDGTQSGTFQLAEIYPGATGSEPRNFIEVNGMLFFTAKHPTYGEELWMYDPVTNDTNFLKDIYAGTSDSQISNMFNFNGTLLFTAISANEGNEIWKSDGTRQGTMLIKDINLSGNAIDIGFPAYFTSIGNYAYFVAAEPFIGKEIYRTDGTAIGTGLYEEIDTNYTSNPQDLIAVDSILYFRAITAQYGAELYKINSNVGGWEIVKDINPQFTGAYFSINNPASYKMVNLHDTLFFVANNGPSGLGDELWMTSSQDTTAHNISNLNGGIGDSNISHLYVFNGKVYFSATNGVNDNGQELFCTNGTQYLSPALFPFADIISGPNSSSPYSFVTFNNRLYFLAASFDTLYETDGVSWQSIAGQARVSNLCPASNALFFQSYDLTNGYELWKLTPNTTGVESTLSRISLSPNPTPNTFTITTSSPIQQVEIYTLTGQLVYTQLMSPTLTHQIDLGSFESGMYIATITTSEGRSTQRIIKQ